MLQKCEALDYIVFFTSASPTVSGSRLSIYNSCYTKWNTSLEEKLFPGLNILGLEKEDKKERLEGQWLTELSVLSLPVCWASKEKGDISGISIC